MFKLFKSRATEKEDMLIAFLRRFKSNGFYGTTRNELIKIAIDYGYFTKEEGSKLLECITKNLNLAEICGNQVYLKYILISQFVNEVKFTNLNLEGQDRYFLKNENYFNLLDFDELQLARSEAVSARRFATSAILISILSMILSLIFSLVQLNSPTTLKDPVKINQEQVTNLNSSLNEINRTLNEIVHKDTTKVGDLKK